MLNLIKKLVADEAAQDLAEYGIALAVIGVIAACAHAPPPEDLSILDSIENHHLSRRPASCAEMNATAVCEKSTRLDGDRECRCVDTRALTGAGALRL